MAMGLCWYQEGQSQEEQQGPGSPPQVADVETERVELNREKV